MRDHRAQVTLATVFLLVGFLVGSSSEVFGQSEGRNKWWTSESVRVQLGLTDEQVERIGELQEEKNKQLSTIRAEVVRAMREVIGALDDPSTSEEILAEKRRDLEDAWALNLQVTIDHWIELRQVLSAEQWKELPNAAPRALRLGMLGLRARSTTQVQE